jgi:cytochrome P450
MKDIPAAKGHWLFGHALTLSKNPLQMPADMANRQGGAARFRVLHRPFLAITDPVLARHILQKNPDNYPRSFHYEAAATTIGYGLLSVDGEAWKRSRKMMQPAFRIDPVREVAAVTARCWNDIERDYLKRMAEGRAVDMVLLCQRLALDVILRALCSLQLETEEVDHFGALVKAALLRLRMRNNAVVSAPLWLPTANNRVIHRVRHALDAFLGPVVDRCMDQPEGDDMLSALARAKDEQGFGFTREELLDQTKTLFAAGFETTATAMAWVMCELADRPELCDRLSAEADSAFGTDEVSRSTIDQLPLAGRVVEEALRLYPTVYNLGRRSRHDDEVNGLHIPGGVDILISIWGMHRGPHWGEAAEQFDPDRWLPERHPAREAYMPFAAGRHTCIGIHFALVEMQMMVALICHRFHLRWAPGASRPGVRPQITASPDGPVWLELEPR